MPGNSQLEISHSRWRAVGPYLPTFTSKAGLVIETKQFLRTYSQLGDLERSRRFLIDEGLPQRSRITRQHIMDMLYLRLIRWQPPTWVLDDLVNFARAEQPEQLQTALLLHVSRQDVLAYDFIQQVIVPRWREGESRVAPSDVQKFLDLAQTTTSQQPKLAHWRYTTREKLSQHLLAALRDYGLLSGKTNKQIVEPVVPTSLVLHLKRLLEAEGIPSSQLVEHPDWQLWLWDEARAKAALADLGLKEEKEVVVPQ